MGRNSEKKELPMLILQKFQNHLTVPHAYFPCNIKRRLMENLCGNVLDVGRNILFLQKTGKRLLKKHGDHQDNFMYSKIGDYS